MNRKPKNCYFFGTFNPPHLGHIRLAEHIKREFSFEKIIFVPAFAPPHKETLDFHHRFNMVCLAVPPELGVVSDIEKSLEPPTYSFKTINKICAIAKKEELWDDKVPFILGYDSFIWIEKWKNPEILKEKVKFIVLKRHSGVADEEILALKDRGFDFTVSNADYFDIESNKIREMVQNNVDTDGFIDKKVERYIYDNKLYK